MRATRNILATSLFGRRWSLRYYFGAGALLLAFMIVLVAVVGFRSELASAVEVYQEEGLSGIYQAVNRKMERYGLRHVVTNIDWESVTPESQGMDGAKLDSLLDDLVKRETDSFLVIRRDKVVYEWYAPDQGSGKRHSVASLAKAITGSIALLVALDDGRIKLDDLASSYIPAWRDDPVKSRITIRELATHSSGVENVPLRDVVGTGWKEIYYLNRNERFSLALTTAPVIFEPGTQYSYSGTGYYALAYAITNSIQDAPQSGISTLLRERIMKPLGIPDGAWDISYGESYNMDGLKLQAIGSGGKYTARAIARLGQFMLNRGNYLEHQLATPDLVETITTYAGTPIYRGSDAPEPAPGLGWWVNFDGFWPSLPRDAFLGAGAGHQILLVIPSLELVVVRTGEKFGLDKFGGDFWRELEKALFEPLMEAVVQ